MKKYFIALFLFFLSTNYVRAQSMVTARLTTAGIAPACGTTACLNMPVNATFGGATFTLAGTWTGTVSFFGSGDGGTTLVALSVTPSNSSTAVTTSTANGTWQVNVAGYTNIYAIFTTATSGTVVATINSATASARGGSGGGGGGAITITSGQVAFGGALANTINGSSNFTFASGILSLLNTCANTPVALFTICGAGAGTAFAGNASNFESTQTTDGEFSSVWSNSSATGNTGTTRTTFLGIRASSGDTFTFTRFAPSIDGQIILSAGVIGINNTTVQINKGLIRFTGTSSGFADLGVISTAGSPARINLPIATGTSGFCLITDGATPQQTSWSATCGTGGSISGLTTGFIPKAGSATTIVNSAIDDGITTVGVITSTKPISVTPSGGVAGGVTCTAGTAIGHATASTITVECPAAATAYEIILPGASATGIVHRANAANVDTESVSAVALGGADVSGTLTVPNGGTGLTTLTSNVVYKGNGAGAIAVSSCTDDATTFTCTDTGGILAPKFTATGTTAGFVDYPQGSTSVAVAPCSTATSICEQAPAAVTSYLVNKPGVAATGLITNNVVTAVDTQGFTGDAGHNSGAITIGSGSNIGSTSLCSTAICTVGTYAIHAYLDITTACGTSGTYLVSLIYTDDVGSKTVPINMNGTGAVPATGVVTTTSTANFGENVQVIRSTGAASINYSTTATACGTAGPMVGKLYLVAVPIG